MEAHSAVTPQLAFEQLLAESSVASSVLPAIAEVQQSCLLPSGAAETLFFQLLEFSIRLSARAAALSETGAA